MIIIIKNMERKLKKYKYKNTILEINRLFILRKIKLMVHLKVIQNAISLYVNASNGGLIIFIVLFYL